MRCKQCDYPLWGLAARSCPECGQGFVPSEFDFTPGAVRFLCPSCGQQYFGTSPEGHLEPRRFECVSCASPLDIDQMVLEPVSGWESRATRVALAPWVDRTRGSWFGRLFRTIGHAMFTPGRLIEGVPISSGVGSALAFAMIANLMFGLISTAPFLLLFLLSPGGGATSVILISFAVALVAMIVGLLLWALFTHGLLRLTGGAAYPLGRTVQAIAYASGAQALGAIPCLSCFGWGYLGLPWWIVSACIMVAKGQAVHAGRATLCTLVFPILLFLGGGGLYGWMVVNAVGGAGAGGAGAWPAPAYPGSMPNTPVQVGAVSINAALQRSVSDNGAYPAYAGELLLDDGVAPDYFIPGEMNVSPNDARIGRFDLMSMGAYLSTAERDAIEAAAASLPDDVIAHRLGCFVFTYHGIDPASPDPGLWLFVSSPAPDTLQFAPVQRVVGLADGTIASIPAIDWATMLEEQNETREAAGLAPLPDPDTISASSPARSGAGLEP